LNQWTPTCLINSCSISCSKSLKVLIRHSSADQTFYQNNTDIANDFFAGPTYPQCAIDALGYPGNNANN
jgi:hypothetical protein